MKGLLLAGGSGTRLYPTTKATSKQLLPIYDKPMIYYPLSILMLANIREIAIISTKRDIENFKALFGDGKSIGMDLTYLVQEAPNGIAEAFIIAENFIANDSVVLILGDNIFYGQGFRPILRRSADLRSGAIIYAYAVNDPSRFGVVEIDRENNALNIVEKPSNPISNLAVTGLYFYDNEVIKFAKSLEKSARGELEITDINNIYLQNKKLKVEILGRGFAWIDAGTHDSLLEAGSFVATIEKRQGYKIACIEEIAYYNGWINKLAVLEIAKKIKNSSYGQYLQKIVQ